MESSPPSMTSPQIRRRELTQSCNDAFPSRVPLPQSVSSASRVFSSSFRSSSSSQAASPQYANQYRALMERQREVHNEERALWHTERMGLEEIISQLEGSLRRYRAISSSEVSSPIERIGSSTTSNFWSRVSIEGSRDTSTSTTRDEVWRGPQNDVQPTRTFSENCNPLTKQGDRLPSIAEDAPVPSRGQRGSSEHSTNKHIAPHKPSISGTEIDKNLDGITFKTSSRVPSIAKNIMTPQSPSPQSPSPSKVSPGTIELPSNTLGAGLDLYTKDAGHTPLARHNYFYTDGASDAATPTQPEMERPPLEPCTTTVRLPSECSDSYFPAVPEATSGDQDPELKGLLGLTNDESKDKIFLNELDSKLQQTIRSKTFSPETPAVAGAPDKESAADGNGGELDSLQPEPEPKLRMRRSMNFGSAFGSRICGKGL